MSPIVGIDLGTTNSLCAVFEDGKPRLIKNAHGNVLTPSVVGVLPDGQVLVGQAAKELRVTQPQRCGSRFKRYMGTSEKLSLGDQQFTAPQLSSLVLKSLKHDAEADLGVTVEEAVITVPAYFNDHQRRATKLAGELAGFRVRRIINEPTAAALTYGFHDRQAEKHLLVVDLGGGTFDVTLMEIFEGTLEIVATSGESMLGGEDFTDRLVSNILQGEGLHLESCEMRQPLRVARLRDVCELAKQRLAHQDLVEVPVPDEQGMITDQAKRVPVSREQFAMLMTPLLERLLGPVYKALRDGERAPETVAEIICVGGATRLNCMHDFIAAKLGAQPLMTFNPDEVVALGAAVQAALLSQDRAVDDMVMTDVCPHTLGVEVAKLFGSQRNSGYFEPIIHRNTTIPVSRESVFCTIEPNQYTVKLKVYQGESRKVKDNLALGELSVDGLPPGPPGTEFVVRFTYDTNGILEVEAFVPATGKKYSTVLTQPQSSLSEDEVAEAVKRMQAVKFYPRDELENQRLLRYCERLVGEVSPMHREQLESAIDVWEAAMSSGDREFFLRAREGLLIVLSQLGYEFESDSGAE
ncbi:MAG: Hsp70 family protein [Pirellulaceae bacterium]|nr:Hsp70 family protein [Pirellulaceae bacterium]